MTEHESAVVPPLTGHPDIDRVLDLISGLDQRPVEEHAEVFAAAQDDLRATLDSRTSDALPA